ncbi:transcription factor S-II, central domain-containing protein [Irpex rosettiformis]|uniref:Transcription factor S-II, central domain-containing protein n=1 Tax=Irpex rosettiformis TaxID=378272 RepID=A0ACB8TRC0_9APHY|nr:transcription factor S-II, central domain-containing protein [Irpex rosettiformis]
MSAASELRSLVKQLQSSSTEQEILGILATLNDFPTITEAIIRESKAGLAIGKLRAHASKQVSDVAKELVKKWKHTVDQAKHSRGSSATSATPKPPARKQSTSVAPSTPTTPSASTSGGSIAQGKSVDLRTAKTDGISGTTGDTTRNKCMELIYDSLAFDSGAPSDQISGRAKGIEVAVFNEFGGTTTGYKAKIRSLFVNLKDKNNPGLRESVVSGDLPVQRFAKMTSAEMASEERKAADSKIKSENLFNSLGAGEVQAETDAFQCGRCKQRKCRYRQAQTRSADEPMTTFVTCTVCNNRWKFS